jgi:hypothetical protein
MKFANLSPEERAEVDALIHEAYIDGANGYRSHAAALVEFDRLLAGAVQAQRAWAGLLLDDWREAGMRSFLQDRWKHSALFEFEHHGRRRTRTVNRGVRRPDSVGRLASTQLPLWEWTADDLRAAIADASRQVAEHQANIALYRDMLTLLEQTGAATFSAALTTAGHSWDDWLEARAV